MAEFVIQVIKVNSLFPLIFIQLAKRLFHSRGDCRDILALHRFSIYFKTIFISNEKNIYT